MMFGYAVKLLLWSVVIKAVQVAIVYITPAQFDISSRHYEISEIGWVNIILNRFIHWDNVYFHSLFKNGPQFEHEWVFGPLWWRLINIIPVENKFILATLVSNLLHYLTSLLVLKLTQLKFHDLRKSYLSGIFTILSPMGVFSAVPYSENLSNFLILLGLVLYYNKKSQRSYLLSSIPFGLSILTRSNTVILGALFLYDFITQFSILSLISGSIMGSFIIILNYIPYKHFCPERSEWCDSTIPSIYSFAQGHYWNVGFMKYWTINNIFNFVIASPTLFLIFRSIKHYWSKDVRLSIVGLLHFILVVLFIHVQIVLRVSGFLPIIYWYLSDMIIQDQGQYWILYLVLWIPLQTTLFASFLPPA